MKSSRISKPRRATRHSLIIGLATSTLLVVSACAGTPASDGAEEPEDITFAMSFSPTSSYFAVHMAQDEGLGFFSEEGLNVSVEDAGGSTAAMQQVIAGNAEIGFVTSASFLSAISEGFDPIWVFQHFYMNRFHVIALEDGPVQSIEDLEGKVIGVSDLAGGEVPTVRATLGIAGLVEGQDVEVLPIGEGTAAANTLTSGRVDAMGVSVPDIVNLQQEGIELKILTPPEVGAFPGDGFVVERSYLESNRDVVVRLVRAAIKSNIWTQSNFDGAYAVLSRPGLAEDQLADESYGVPFTKKAIEDSMPPSGVQTGEADPAAMQSWADALYEYEVLAAPVDPGPYMDPDIVREAMEGIDADEIRDSAASFKP